MRVLLALLLAASFATVTYAQPQPSRQPTTPSTSPATQVPARPTAQSIALETDAREVRDQFALLLSKYPPELGRILKMDPTMLANEQYLAQYPSVQQFLAAHPEIVRNPAFYLGFVQLAYDYTRPVDPRSRALEIWNDVVESIGVFVIVVFISSMIAWLVKTLLNHRRWQRASRVQNEVHNKLLDRFTGTNELLSYVQSPAGQRFLEAAPIPVDAPADRPIAAPLNRIMWSVQAGIVLVIGGLGFQYVSGRVVEEVSQGMWTMGVLASAFGLGFIVAGAFSFIMSRRLGLLDPPAPPRGIERSDSTAV
jgi:hypothetical protein